MIKHLLKIKLSYHLKYNNINHLYTKEIISVFNGHSDIQNRITQRKIFNFISCVYIIHI